MVGSDFVFFGGGEGEVSEELLLAMKGKSGFVLGHSLGVKGHDQVGGRCDWG